MARVVVLLLVLLASTVLTPKKETKGMKMNWVKLHYNLVKSLVTFPSVCEEPTTHAPALIYQDATRRSTP